MYGLQCGDVQFRRCLELLQVRTRDLQFLAVQYMHGLRSGEILGQRRLV